MLTCTLITDKNKLRQFNEIIDSHATNIVYSIDKDLDTAADNMEA